MYRDDLIRAAMGAQNTNRVALAEKTGLNVNTISSICRGEEGVRVPTLKKVANALGLSMADLFTPRSEQVQEEEPATAAG